MLSTRIAWYISCFWLLFLFPQSGMAEVPISVAAADGGNAAVRTAPSVHEIVNGMVARNAERAQALKGFEGKRIYRLEYKGFPAGKSAELEVEIRFVAPATKEFRIVSQSGSGILIDRVLKKLLESERDAAGEQERERSALSPANYTFAFDHMEQNDGRAQYVLSVEPLRKEKFLYRGKIWVDEQDLAVTRIEAEPARNPSFWIKKTEISHRYSKFGDFWLPVQNLSQSNTRLGGHAMLQIEYMDYRVNSLMQKSSHDVADSLAP